MAASPTSTAGTSRPLRWIRPRCACPGTRRQASRCKEAGSFYDPEQLEPASIKKRWSASALFAREIAPGFKLAATLSGAASLRTGTTTMRLCSKGHSAVAGLRSARVRSPKIASWADFDKGPAYRVGKVRSAPSATSRSPITCRRPRRPGRREFRAGCACGRFTAAQSTGAMGFLRLKVD